MSLYDRYYDDNAMPGPGVYNDHKELNTMVELSSCTPGNVKLYQIWDLDD